MASRARQVCHVGLTISMLIANASPSFALDLNIMVRVPNPLPLPQVYVERADSDEPKTATSESGSNYSASISTGPQWVARYRLVAAWPDNNKRQLNLKITPAQRKAISLTVYNKNFPINDDFTSTFSELRALGSDKESLLEKYFVARDVWRRLDPKSADGKTALQFWK